jgi:DNA-directed RNA polymerase alpha subunit
LDLSSRTLNCLKRAGLNRVGEVMEKPRSELLSIRNFGEKSYTELYDKFRELDILPAHLDPNNDSEIEGITDSEQERSSSESIVQE